jgi:hypothetical protein
MRANRRDCTWCGEAVLDGEGKTLDVITTSGIDTRWIHDECEARGVIGSLAHVEGRCRCAVPGSEAGDPPGLTKRQAAQAALSAWLAHWH